jgi:hypothetical protein
MMDIGDNGMVVGHSYRKFLQSKDGRSREWVSIIECISADGQFLPPLVIFAGKHVQQQWYPDAEKERYADWYFEAFPKDWTNDDIAVQWLKRVFIPFTKPENPEEWRLLILDGHKSHTTPLFMAECLSHKIWVVFLPAHTSHVLQPCDLGFFSRMKPAYRRKLSIACALNAYDNPKNQNFWRPILAPEKLPRRPEAFFRVGKPPESSLGTEKGVEQ